MSYSPSTFSFAKCTHLSSSCCTPTSLFTSLSASTDPPATYAHPSATVLTARQKLVGSTVRTLAAKNAEVERSVGVSINPPYTNEWIYDDTWRGSRMSLGSVFGSSTLDYGSWGVVG